MERTTDGQKYSWFDSNVRLSMRGGELYLVFNSICMPADIYQRGGIAVNVGQADWFIQSVAKVSMEHEKIYTDKMRASRMKRIRKALGYSVP